MSNNLQFESEKLPQKKTDGNAELFMDELKKELEVFIGGRLAMLLSHGLEWIVFHKIEEDGAGHEHAHHGKDKQ